MSPIDDARPLAQGRLPADGLVRLREILRPVGPLPISKTAWWAGVAAGRFPQPVRLGPGIAAWRVDEVRALYEPKP
jgi:predicted DNA-binding transcriptional regulator AlpA